MNRRKFLRSIGGFLVAIPFLMGMKEQKPIVCGVDKASQDDDYTEWLLFNNVSPDEFEVIKENYIESIRGHKFTIVPTANHFNCKCQLEWIETE